MVDAADWSDYLERFLAEHAGITERILSRCRSDGINPYEWCAEPLAGRPAPVVDIACGSGPMADHLGRWIGTDRSATELAIAWAAGREPLIRCSATQLPVADRATGAVVCSMAMQVIQPVTAAIARAGPCASPRRSGGAAASRHRPTRVARCPQVPARASGIATTDRPSQRPGPIQPTARVRRRIMRPEDRERRTPKLLAFNHVRQEVVELVHSLYLPGISPRRLRHAARVLSGQVGSELAVPLRRVVLDGAG